MMSSTPDSSHVQARKPTVNNTTQTSSGNRKTSAAGSSTTPKPPDHNQQVLKCPRCDSPNTKFCYYNNYSLTQPRHFCKTCRRYWTKGGALRNVPIGGGCRKSKKNKSSTSGLCFSTSSSNIKQDYSFDTDGSSSFKLFHGGFSPSFDQFDQFGRIPFSRLTSSISTNGLFNNNHHHHQLVSFGDLSSNSTPTPPSVNPCFNMEPASLSSGSSLMGFNHLGVGSSSSVFKQGDIENTTTELFHGGGEGGLVPHHHHQDMGPMTSHHHNSSNLASTMESLSSINQELHWKLQQERLAMLFGGGDNQNTTTTTTHNNNMHHHHQHHQNKEISSTSVSSISGDLVLDHQNQQQTQKPLPISFQNLEISKQELVGGGNNPSKKGNSDHGNEWLFDQNTYNSSSIPTTPATNNSSTWKGIQAWSDHLHNYM